MSSTNAESGSSVPPASKVHPEEAAAPMAAPGWLRTLAVFAAVAASYVLCLWLVFPGYFDPLYPLHSDFYTPPGMSMRNPSLWSYVDWPRPIGYLTADLLGRTGLQGYIFSLVAVTLVNVTLTVKLVRRIVGRDISLLLVVVYCFLLFSHPQFYLSYVHDTLATLSYLYLVIGLNAWYAYRSRPSNWWIGVCVLSFALLALTKETYFVSAVLLWAVQVFVCRGRTRRIASYLLVALIALEGFGLYINLTSTEPFIQLQNELASPYYMDFSAGSLLSVFAFYAMGLLNPVLVVVILGGLAMLYPQRNLLLASGALVLAGFAAILPHTPLPQHLDAQYAWTPAPLVMSPILFVAFCLRPGWTKHHTTVAGVSGALVALSIWINQPVYAENRWIVEQEQINRNIIAAYPQLKSALHVGEKILVAGLKTPVHPFYDSYYVSSEFGAQNQWTVLVPRWRDEHDAPPVTLAKPENVRIQEFDRAFGFDEKGRLVKTWSREELMQLSGNGAPSISAEDLVLFPALSPLRETLRQDPDQWYPLLQAGVIFWDWGRAEKAKYHLHRAAQANHFQNPYPLFFLGQVHEWEGSHSKALNYYQRAIDLDEEGNPEFRSALEQLKRKIVEGDDGRPRGASTDPL